MTDQTQPPAPGIFDLSRLAMALLGQRFVTLVAPLFTMCIATAVSDVFLLGWWRQMIEAELAPQDKLGLDLLLNHQHLFMVGIFGLLPLTMIFSVVTFTIGWAATVHTLAELRADRVPHAVDSLLAGTRAFFSTTSSLAWLSLPCLVAAGVFSLALSLAVSGWSVLLVSALALVSAAVYLWGYGFLHLYFPLTLTGRHGRAAFVAGRTFAKITRQNLVLVSLNLLMFALSMSALSSLLSVFLPSSPSIDYSELANGTLSARDAMSSLFESDPPVVLAIRFIIVAFCTSVGRAFAAAFATVWYFSETK